MSHPIFCELLASDVQRLLGVGFNHAGVPESRLFEDGISSFAAPGLSCNQVGSEGIAAEVQPGQGCSHASEESDAGKGLLVFLVPALRSALEPLSTKPFLAPGHGSNQSEQKVLCTLALAVLWRHAFTMALPKASG